MHTANSEIANNSALNAVANAVDLQYLEIMECWFSNFMMQRVPTFVRVNKLRTTQAHSTCFVIGKTNAIQPRQIIIENSTTVYR